MQFSDHGIHPFIVLIFTLYRLLIAAPHFNENYGREQAKTATGAELCFLKSKQGECTPNIIPVPKTYS